MNDECNAASGEGAEHYNAKLYLASVLRQERKFRAFEKCRRCAVVRGMERLEYEYDRVELEHTYPNRMRADVALFSGDQLVCVIEIYVSHRCEYEKIAYHRESGIPCLEISAQHAQKWHPSKPLSPDAIYGIERWTCPACQEESEREEATSVVGYDHDARPLERFEDEAKHIAPGKVEHKVIGLQKIFFNDPLRDSPFRESFVTIELTEDFQGGKSLYKSLTLWDSRSKVSEQKVYAPYDDEKAELLRQAYRSYLGELEASYGHLRKGEWLSFQK